MRGGYRLQQTKSILPASARTKQGLQAIHSRCISQDSQHRQARRMRQYDRHIHDGKTFRCRKRNLWFALLGVRPVAPCRVTNTGEEMMEPGMFGHPDYMEVDQMQIPHPELGPLERRVEKTYEEALFEEDISIEDAEYWFTEPPGGWNQEKKKLRKAPVVPNEYAHAQNLGEGRIKMSELEEGQVVMGTINRCMLFHGAQVDFGAEYDALIPVGEEDWLREGQDGVRELQQALQLEVEVRIKIHKIVNSPICRFPIIAELLSLNLEGILPKVEDYEPVFDLRGQSDIEVAKQLTGRTYIPTNYWLDVVPDTATRGLQAASDELNPDEVKEVYETMSPALLARIRDMAVR